MNNFDIKQNLAWNICFIIYPQYQAKSWVNANKAEKILMTTELFFQKKFSTIAYSTTIHVTTKLNYLNYK